MSKKEESPWIVGAKCTVHYGGGPWYRDKWEILTIVKETKKQVVTSDGKRWWNEERQNFSGEAVLRMVGHRNELQLFKPEHALLEKRSKAWAELLDWWLDLSKIDKNPPTHLSNKQLSAVYKATRALRRKLKRDK